MLYSCSFRTATDIATDIDMLYSYSFRTAIATVI